MSDGEIRDQLMTLLVAGHETTATGLAWTLDLLTRHPDVHGREARTTASRTCARSSPSRCGCARSSRWPAAGSRSTSRPTALTLPAGTDVTPAIWLAHTRPEEYPEPYAFRPERFLDRPPSTYTWIPFGGGVRRCIGAPFAEIEMRIVLAAILARFDLRAAGRARRAHRPPQRHLLAPPRHPRHRHPKTRG